MRRLALSLIIVMLAGTLIPGVAAAGCQGQSRGAKGSAGCAWTTTQPSPTNDPGVKTAPPVKVKPCLSNGVPVPCALPFSTTVPTTPNPTINVTAVASSAALQLEVPAPNPLVGPDPSRNKWNMIPIGFPIWIWSEQPASVSATTTQQGITISMVATAGPTTVDFGDGTTIICQTMTPRAQVLNPPTQASPDCGHVYRDKGTYTITATTTWSVQWQAMGHSGNLTLSNSAGTSLRVGELTAVLVPDP